ncbi:MAG TPA: hypothetical protein VGC87_23760 [Pyrinomonadaceae bacterium]|jgi:hypothetical protein
MFISIFSGEAEGFGAVVEDGDAELPGICIPGMDVSIFSGEADGVGDGVELDDGISIPGIFICSGDAPGWAEGVFAGIPDMPGIFMSIFRAGAFFDREEARDEEGIFMPLIPPLFCVCFPLAAVDFDLDLALDFGLPLGLLPMFMPGMFCISCCAHAGTAATPRSRKATAMAQNFERKIDLKVFMIPSRIIPL